MNITEAHLTLRSRGKKKKNQLLSFFREGQRTEVLTQPYALGVEMLSMELTAFF